MLTKFREMLVAGSGEDAVTRPPFVIKAGDLDKNFGLCYPLPMDGDNTPYKIVRPGGDDGGFRLKGTRVFDVCENGQPVQYLFFAEKLPTPSSL